MGFHALEGVVFAVLARIGTSKPYLLGGSQNTHGSH